MTTSHGGWSNASKIAAMGIVCLAGARCLAVADPPVVADVPAEPNSLPQDGFFSSLKQNLSEGEQEVVRGHFDLGTAPNVRRYYCLVNPKTGHREPNGVVGDPVTRPDGMTGIKISAVSLYVCAKAEQKGYLVSTGYVLHLARQAAVPAATSTAPPPVAAAAPPPAAPPPAPSAPPAVAMAPAAAHMPADRIDVAGIKLGMSPDEVRGVLKSKKQRHYKEWTETLSFNGAKGVSQPVPNGRFVNVIATWTPPASSAPGDDFESDGESFEVMFTPVPGAERVMAIIHSEGYSPADAIHETTLDAGLVKKYGGYIAAGDLPESVTWRFQSDGSVQVGDACGRRGTLGGLGGSASRTPRARISLCAERRRNFETQLERCGDATVTADHFTPNGGALPADRLVTRFTVTAFSTAIALDGAKKASQLVAAAGRAPAPAGRAKDVKTPDL